MPYKLSGTKVMQQKGGKWVVLKAHKTRKEAQKHLAALKINVKE